MNSKILFWMNDDLSGLGLPKILNEKYNLDIYSVFDITDKQKIFFQNQKLINFTKIWFYHDYISKSFPKADDVYLKNIEEKYDLNLSLLISAERFFTQSNLFYDFTQEEKLSIVEQTCKFFENTLDEIKPDFVIMGITTLLHNHIFFKICKNRGIKILMIRPSFLAGKYIISNSIDSFENNVYEKKFNFHNNHELTNYLKNYNSTEQSKFVRDNFQSSIILYFKAILHYIFSKNSNPDTHFTYFGRTKIKVIQKMISYTLKTKIRKSFIDKNLILKIKNKKPYIYFPLQIEQERSLSLAAPSHTNQIEVIKNILKNLPKGYELYIKEHPMMILRGWRPTSDYKEIINLPNVKLFHPNLKSDTLIRNSSLVITISSTSGIEAAFMEKPSIVFADVDYVSISSVEKMNSINELSNLINNSLEMKPNIDDLNNYLNLVESNSFELNLLKLSSEFDSQFHFTGLLADVEIPLQKMKSYLDNNHDIFEKLAIQFIKKIRN